MPGEAGDEPAVNRPNSNEAIRRKSYKEVTSWRYGNVRDWTAQSAQVAFELTVNFPNPQHWRINIVIGGNQRASVGRECDQVRRAVFCVSYRDRAQSLARPPINVDGIIQASAADNIFAVGREAQAVREVGEELAERVTLEIP